MLPKNSRLNLKKDFKWVVSGKKIDSKYCKLSLIMGENQVPKIGIAVSSKNFKKAVDRNRVRRVVSAAFESLYSLFPAKLNIVALPKASVLDVKSGDVLLELEEILINEHVILGSVATPGSRKDSG